MINNQYYPTPPSLALKMWDKIKGHPRNILEPSAGRGALIEAGPRKGHAQIDVCEIDLDNAAILRSKGYPVVAHDFLTFTTPKQYSAIILNPPFSNGVHHVLHAYDNVLTNGQIVALLNAETIKNPCDRERQRLVKILEKDGNEVEFLESAFTHDDVQRKTNVEVALISLHKHRDINLDYGFLKDLSKDDMPKQTTLEGDDIDLNKSIAIPQSVVERAVTIYNAACRALRREIDIASSLTDTTNYYTRLLEHSLLQSEEEVKNASWSDSETTRQRESYNERIMEIKERAWSTVLKQTKIGQNLSRSVMQDLTSRFEQVSALEFTEQNILSFLLGLSSQTSEMQMQMLAEVHRSFLSYHSENQLYYKGWKSNNRHRVAFKIRSTRIILPLRRSSWSNSIEWGEIEKFKDIDKAMDLLAGYPECTYALSRAIQANEKNGSERFSAGHFEIRMYSSTIHLYPNDQKLIDTLNLWVGRFNQWIPPEVSDSDDDLFWEQYKQAGKYQSDLMSAQEVRRMNVYRITNPTHSDQREPDIFNETLDRVATEKGFNMNFRALACSDNKQLSVA